MKPRTTHLALYLLRESSGFHLLWNTHLPVMIRASREHSWSVHVLLACSASYSSFIAAYQFESLSAARTDEGMGNTVGSNEMSE